MGEGIAINSGAISNTIGGTSAGAAQVHDYNSGNGITVGTDPGDTAATGNTILGNVLFENQGIGIDLGNEGPTVNDSAGHAGPNHFQNYPVVTAYNSSTMTVSGTFHEDGEIGKALRIEFFAGTPSILQGNTYVGSTNVTTDGNGDASFTDVALSNVPPGTDLGLTATATATSAGDTSELSPVFVVTTTTTTLQASPSPFKSGQPINLLATVAVPTGGNPSGSVEFKDETMSFGSAPVVDGQASKSITLPEGQYNITAIYTSDNSLPGSSSDPLPLTVNAADADTTSISATPAFTPAREHEGLLFTGTVSNTSGTVVPSGDVQLVTSGASPTLLGSGTLVNGGFSITINGLAQGLYGIDANYLPASSSFTTSTTHIPWRSPPRPPSRSRPRPPRRRE